MDFFTFLDSACALIPYLKACALHGVRGFDLPPDALFGLLRRAGLDAEREMFSATRGVNTHKGIVFSMGILCAAAGTLWVQSERFSAENLCMRCGELAAGGGVLSQLGKLSSGNAATAGEKLYVSAGVTGVRGEVAGGLSSVRKVGLPVLSKLLARGWHPNDAGAVTLLHLVASVADTNLMARGTVARQQALSKSVSELLSRCEAPDPERIRAPRRAVHRRALEPRRLRRSAGPHLRRVFPLRRAFGQW
jgi:triphosphoribosyl-dephospho-CoA synthetase